MQTKGNVKVRRHRGSVILHFISVMERKYALKCLPSFGNPWHDPAWSSPLSHDFCFCYKWLTLFWLKCWHYHLIMNYVKCCAYSAQRSFLGLETNHLSSGYVSFFQTKSFSKNWTGEMFQLRKTPTAFYFAAGCMKMAFVSDTNAFYFFCLTCWTPVPRLHSRKKQ